MTAEFEGLDLIPEHYPDCREGMRRYINDGVRPGPFIFAILTNDLFRAHFYARVSGSTQIDDYITFLTKYAPPNCFGSRAKVEAWIEDAAERRAMANVAGPQT